MNQVLFTPSTRVSSGLWCSQYYQKTFSHLGAKRQGEEQEWILSGHFLCQQMGSGPSASEPRSCAKNDRRSRWHCAHRRETAAGGGVFLPGTREEGASPLKSYLSMTKDDIWWLPLGRKGTLSQPRRHGMNSIRAEPGNGQCKTMLDRLYCWPLKSTPFIIGPSALTEDESKQENACSIAKRNLEPVSIQERQK